MSRRSPPSRSSSLGARTRRTPTTARTATAVRTRTLRRRMRMRMRMPTRTRKWAPTPRRPNARCARPRTRHETQTCVLTSTAPRLAPLRTGTVTAATIATPQPRRRPLRLRLPQRQLPESQSSNSSRDASRFGCLLRCLPRPKTRTFLLFPVLCCALLFPLRCAVLCLCSAAFCSVRPPGCAESQRHSTRVLTDRFLPYSPCLPSFPRACVSPVPVPAYASPLLRRARLLNVDLSSPRPPQAQQQPQAKVG